LHNLCTNTGILQEFAIMAGTRRFNEDPEEPAAYTELDLDQPGVWAMILGEEPAPEIKLHKDREDYDQEAT
jgi:hypothetical protein